jgi:D-alanyl-lipoteichoic acid acyltransferase DltB (MBOAT superfamily)
MSISLLSVEFLLFSALAVALIALLRGMLRQGVFLALNLSFVVHLLGPSGTLSTGAFCLLGYALTQAHLRWPRLRIAYTLPLFVLLFVYMRDYEFLRWLLPPDLLTSALRTIGLSFLFFKIIHVLVDAKSGTLGKLEFPTYVNYCLAFTTFMMGPIQRYQDYYAQWHGTEPAIPLSFEAHLDAGLRILVGLVKAYVLAGLVNRLALQPGTDVLELNATGWLVQLYAFTIFLYLNFSGYCDVVIGVGSLLGVRPPENFDKPFIARNISDFWQRQHRSLTLWLTDYVFAPTYKRALSGIALARHPLLAANLALMLTMVVSGLWHGTTIGFLIFGLVHGTYLVVYHTWDHLLVRSLGRKRVIRLRQNWLARAIGIVLTFNAVAFAFLFFRLETTRLLQLLNAMVPT